MHLIEQYALSCGVKIGKPFIETSFYPVPADKYITLHASSGMDAKNYDYFNDVVELILPYLSQEGISIIQIGEAKDAKIHGCMHYTGTTNLKQVCYLIQNSLLHLGNDSFGVHVASGFNKKIVGLYSVLYKECCGPYWGEKDKQILLEPCLSKRKPSFSNKENPKRVNEIMPEEVAKSALTLLEIPNSLSSINTLHIGPEYHLPSVAVIPNHIMPAEFLKGQPINILGDECFDEQNIIQWAYNRKVCIFMKEPMKIQYLRMIKENIIQVSYEASMDTEPEYLKALTKLGITTKIFSKDESAISDIRLKLFDWNIELLKTKDKKSLDNVDKICDNTRYKNSRILFSNGQKYQSKAAWRRGNTHTDDPKIVDCPEFWEEISTLKLYNKEDNHGKTKRKQEQTGVGNDSG
jgi:hypothetical protein